MTTPRLLAPEEPSPPTSPSRRELPTPVTDGTFAKTFCRNCEAGWERQLDLSDTTSVIIICKLDFERVHPRLALCDNFEERKLVHR